MKKMLKISLFIALFAATSVAYSQISIGAKAGLNLANVLTDDDEADPKMLPSFQVGVVVELGLTESVAIQTGASVQGKGFKEESEFLGEKFTFKAMPMYVQVPAHIVYNGSGFFVGAGPYVAFGIGGKFKAEGGGNSESESISFGNSDTDDMAPLDFGIGAQAGVNVGPVKIGAGYDFGLAQIIPKDQRGDGSPSVKNGVINVFVSYFFGQ
ncbi:MAG: porin family protein [Saprospiraceae bacterium]